MIQFLDIQIEDLEQLRIWRTSPEVASNLFSEPNISFEDQLNWFLNVQKQTNSLYKIISYKGEKVGLISVTNIDKVSKKGVFGLFIGDLKAKSKGVGAMATFYFIEHFVFGELNLNRFYSEVLETNQEAIKLNEHFGFRREGYMREFCYKNNKYYDALLFSLLKSDWNKLKYYFYKNFKYEK